MNETETPMIATIIFAISSFVICSTQAINFLQGTLLAFLVATFVATLSIIQYNNGQDYISDFYLVLNSADNYVRVYTISYIILCVIGVLFLIFNDLHQLITLRKRPHEMIH